MVALFHCHPSRGSSIIWVFVRLRRLIWGLRHLLIRECLTAVAVASFAATLLGGSASAQRVARLSYDLPPSCAEDRQSDVGVLLGRESEYASQVMRRPEEETRWRSLACVRAALEAAGAVGSRTGPEMNSGDAWAFGALGAARRAVELDPASPASDVLGWVTTRERPEDLPEWLLALLTSAVDHGRRTPDLLRGCAHLALALDQRSTAVRCSDIALTLGQDSTFHLLRQARVAYAQGDHSQGESAFFQAADAVDGAMARAELRWHLRWFLTPDELDREPSVADSAFGRWLRDRIAARDVRDARPPGTRLAEHFERLEFVLQNFRLRLPREAWKSGGLVAAAPEDNTDPDAVRQSCEPGTVPARRYRFYQRWQGEIDDRGAVWMRFGPPLKRVRAAPTCLRSTEQSAVLREAWLYRIDGVELLLHFENERYDGSSAPTRLVAGVLGSYLCDVDAWRCALTERAKERGRALPLEQLNRVIDNDSEMLALATTRDDNSVRSDKPIAVRAAIFRLWSPQTQLPVSLVTWATPLKDLKIEGGRAQLSLEIRRWSPRASEWHDTTLARSYPVPQKPSRDAALTGALLLPDGHGVTAWSVSLAQDSSRQGRSWGERDLGTAQSSVALSDLIVGDAGQGPRWREGDLDVPLAPLGAIPRDRRASLFFQIRSVEAHAGARLRVAIIADRGRGTPDRPALQISAPQPFASGVSGVQRELDLRQLDAGQYRIRVTLLDANGGVLATQESELTVK